MSHVYFLPFLRLTYESEIVKMKNWNPGLLITLLAMIAFMTSCDDKLEKMIGTKWTLEQITTEHGQDLYPDDYYSVEIQEKNLLVQLDVNKCRTPYTVTGKNQINLEDKMSCTRMCCDSRMAEALRDKLVGVFTIEMDDDKLVLKGKETITFRKWSKHDVKREDSEDYLKIKRTGCFGTCPIYEMTLFSDGSAKYTGKRFVEVTGKQNHNFDANRVKELMRRADEIDFKKLQAVYDNPSISDMESVYIEHNGTTIKVRYKMDVPKELLELIADVHQCSIDAGWVKEQ